LLPVQPQTFNLAGLHSSTGGVVRQVERHGPPATVEHVVKGGGVTAEDDLALAGAEYRGQITMILLGQLEAVNPTAS
jgi:hypothetical protein